MPRGTLPAYPSIADLLTYRQEIKGQMNAHWYTTPQITILAGAPAFTGQIIIDAASDFLALALMGHSDQEDVAVPINFYTVQISSSQSDRGFQNSPFALHSRVVVGTASLPHYFPAPIYFRAASTINLTVTPLNIAVVYNIFLTFAGIKIFRY